MSAQRRDDPVTRETIHRVFDLPEPLRVAVADRREALGQTLREFLAEAVAHELPQILAGLAELLPPPAGNEKCRPARLPLTEELLAALREGSARAGLPASLLLLACLARASRRKRCPRGSAAAAPTSGRRQPAAGRKRVAKAAVPSETPEPSEAGPVPVGPEPAEEE